MGICDLIPGISGGTIAFITGIYERLIAAVKNFSPTLLVHLMTFCTGKDRKSLPQAIKKLDLIFLITLVLGIGTSIILGAGVISFLLEEYFAFTMAFFIGLILASSKIIYSHIQKHNIILMVIFFILGISLAFLIPPVMEEPSPLLVFVGGFVAISAMFLPGISGAFILLIVGLYEFMLNVLRDISSNIVFFVSFLLGAVTGAMVISRVISFLFKKYKNQTLSALLGLVIGALSIPVKRVLDLQEVSLVIVLFIALGIGIVMIVGKIQNE